MRPSGRQAWGRLLVAHPVCAAGIALSIQCQLGASPWDVFHLGLHHVTGQSVGLATSITAAVAVLIALAAGIRPGPATLVNVLLLGPCSDLALWLLPPAPSPALAAAYAAGGLILIGVGTGLFLSAGLGSGPRDSLMLALARRPRWTVGRARVAIELTALAVGLLLGGQVGLGTVLYALAIGPAVHSGIALFAERAPC